MAFAVLLFLGPRIAQAYGAVEAQGAIESISAEVAHALELEHVAMVGIAKRWLDFSTLNLL